VSALRSPDSTWAKAARGAGGGKAPMTDMGGTRSTGGARRLAEIAQALRKGQRFPITRLTILKALCRAPRDAALFALHLAAAAHREIERGQRPGHITADAWKHHQALAAEAMAAMREPAARPSARSTSRLRDILSRVEEAQSAHVNIPFGVARQITDRPLLIIEYALRTRVSPEEAPDLGYRIGRAFAEQYDPQHGTGLIPTSAPFVETIAEFWSRHLLGRPPAPGVMKREPSATRGALTAPPPRRGPRSCCDR
jgi:hypothetical protein